MAENNVQVHKIEMPKRIEVTQASPRSSILGKILVLIIIVGIAYLIFTFYKSGNLNVIGVKASTFLKGIGAWGEATKGIRNFMKVFTDPAHSFANPWQEETPESKVEQETKGVRVRDLYTSIVEENEPIEISGTVEVENIEGTVNLKIVCELDDYNGKVITRLLEEDKEGSFVNLRVTDIGFRGYDVECIFPDGLKVENDITAKTAYIKVYYDFDVESSLRLYTLSKEKIRLLKRKEDAFERYRLVEPLTREGLWQGDGNIRSESGAGPMTVALSVGKQPVSLGNYKLRVSIKNEQDIWGGDLAELKDIRLDLDEGIEINEEFCKSFSGTRISSKMRDYINGNWCTGLGAGKECINSLLENGNLLICEIKLNELANNDMAFKLIKLKTEYVYKTEASIGVNVRKKTI